MSSPTPSNQVPTSLKKSSLAQTLADRANTRNNIGMGAVDSVEDFLNPCDAIHGCRFGWDDVPDDWRERKDRSGHF
jgi:hypothetical protein